ncbi:hypothetical protein DT73_08005 [Mangrovibacter sp. MFB070]|uniref:sensor domain-containing diguanylate cyclase n=1 Tax=Mangrovibacter sp. MFB070 TaxID=1224318 RepID=UPI0004D9B1F3|nr:diguanylate cyclase [Mangrovibacter sp. MFB070]KEA53294.1 hypothetical protein DT73_08005 [Mangrovibacter sp. MFB070]
MMTTQHTNSEQHIVSLGESRQLLLDGGWAMAEFDLSGNVISANQQFALLMGFSHADELVNINHSQFVLSHGRGTVFWQDVLAGNITCGEFKRCHHDDCVVWLHASYSPVLNKDNELQSILMMAMDITQEKLMYVEYHARLQALDSAQGVIEFDKNGFILCANDNYLAMTGYSERELVGRHHAFLCAKDEVSANGYQRFWKALRRGECWKGRFKRIRKNGQPLWIQANYNPIFDSEGRLCRIVKYAHDITEYVANERKMVQQRALLDILLDAQNRFLHDHDLGSACDHVFTPLLDMTQCEFGFIGIVQDTEGVLSLHIPAISNISWDDSVTRWFDEQMQANNALIFHRLDNIFGQVITHNKIMCVNDVPAFPGKRRFPAGHPPLHNFLGIPIVFNQKPVGMIALANRPQGMDDELIAQLEPIVTTLGTLIRARSLEDKRSEMEARLRFNATHDGLTRLPNRNAFFESLHALPDLNLPSQGMSRHCLALVDVDFFKRINDKYGHLAGDALLQELARLLETHTRGTDLVARLGGEEFIVLLRDVTTRDACLAMERLRAAIADYTFNWEAVSLSFTVSIGVAPWRPEYASMDDWVQQADTNLYQAKSAGRNQVCGP